MAATYAASVTLMADQVFVDKVKVGVVTAALAIKAEAPPLSPGDSAAALKRQQLADVVLADPVAAVLRFGPAVASDPTIEAGAADAALFSRISSVWDALAGVFPWE